MKLEKEIEKIMNGTDEMNVFISEWNKLVNDSDNIGISEVLANVYYKDKMFDNNTLVKIEYFTRNKTNKKYKYDIIECECYFEEMKINKFKFTELQDKVNINNNDYIGIGHKEGLGDKTIIKSYGWYGDTIAPSHFIDNEYFDDLKIIFHTWNNIEQMKLHFRLFDGEYDTRYNTYKVLKLANEIADKCIDEYQAEFHRMKCKGYKPISKIFYKYISEHKELITTI